MALKVIFPIYVYREQTVDSVETERVGVFMSRPVGDQGEAGEVAPPVEGFEGV